MPLLEDIEKFEERISVMQIVDAVKRMDDDRCPGFRGRPPAEEAGHTAMGMQNFDLVLSENEADIADVFPADLLAEGNRQKSKANALNLILKRSTAFRTDKDFEAVLVQTSGERQKMDLASAQKGLVDHLEDSDLPHLGPSFHSSNS
jgi:hypothetical protein